MIFNQQPPTQGGGGAETVTVSIDPEYGTLYRSVADGAGGYYVEELMQTEAAAGSNVLLSAVGMSLYSEEGDMLDDCLMQAGGFGYVFLIPVLDHDMTLISS